MLVLAKKGTTSPTSLTYDQALEEAICFGWIDGQVRRRDERTYFQRFTPRRARSRWSKRNTTLAERLISEGRMQASGIAEVERAKADGRWEARGVHKLGRVFRTDRFAARSDKCTHPGWKIHQRVAISHETAHLTRALRAAGERHVPQVLRTEERPVALPSSSDRRVRSFRPHRVEPRLPRFYEAQICRHFNRNQTFGR
jgi:hypothetical protein